MIDMETINIEVLKLNPDFYCTRMGVCDRMYTCIHPYELRYIVCPHLLIKTPDRELHEEVQSFRKEKE